MRLEFGWEPNNLLHHPQAEAKKASWKKELLWTKRDP